MNIRPVEKTDINEWTRMRNSLWPSNNNVHFQEIDEFFNGGQTHLKKVYVADNGGRHLLGFIELNIRIYDEGSIKPAVPYIEGWYVDSNYRNKSIGRLLVEAAEKWAKSIGYDEIASDSEIDNIDSIKAHNALGFKELERSVCFLKKIG